MGLGFGDNVARLSATLTLDDDGFVRGMAEASTKLDAYNAKLKEEGVGKRLSTMASRDYAKQLYNEARSVDQATQSHGRLITTLQSAQRHWKALAAFTAVGGGGIAAGVIHMTGAFGGLSGILGSLGTATLPVFTGALSALLIPFTSLAAIAVAATGPLAVFSSVLGGIGVGALLGFKNAMASSGPQFAPFRRAVDGLKDGFGNLTHTLAMDFMPWFMKVAPIAKDVLGEFSKLANMAGKGGLNGLFKGLAQGGFARLNQDVIKFVSPIGGVIARVIKFAFQRGGNEGQSIFMSDWKRFSTWLGTAFQPIVKWFDKQHFTRTGARWASEIASTFVPIFARAALNGIEALFSKVSVWGKLGMIAGGAFAANFLGGGLLSKGLLAGGKGLIGMLGGGAAGAGAAGAGEALAGGGAAAAGGAGLFAGLSVAGIAAAVVPVAMIAAEAWASSHAARLNPSQRVNQIFPNGKTTQPTGEAAMGQARFGHLISQDLQDAAKAGSKYAAMLRKIEPEQKTLNQFIKDGGKSAVGWKIAMQQATNQGSTAMKAIHGLADNGFISASKAAADSKQTLQTYVSQEDAIARKATAASHNTAQFGAAARAQYAHVAALARTSADLAAAIDSIPSQKYVSLVLSITENLRSQGNAPGQTPTGIHQTGAFIAGSGSGDIVPAMLEPGEGVLNRNAVAALGGKSAIDAINSAVPRFQGGGIIPPRRHKKEKRGAYRSRVSTWLSNTVGSRVSDLDFGLQIADRIAQRDDQEGKYGAEVVQLEKEQRIRGKEIGVYDRGRRVAHRFGLTGLERQFSQATAFLHQDILDAALTIKGLKGQTSSGGAGSGVAAQIAAFLAEQQTFISQFGSNVNLAGAGNPNIVTSGTPSSRGGGGGSAGGRLPNRTAGGSGGVIIHNHFTQTPPDSFVHIRKAKLQAEAVWA